MSPGKHDKIEVGRIDKGGFEDEDVVGQLYEVFDPQQRGGRQRKVPFQSLLTSGHINPKWRKLKGRHLLGAVF